jgi:hypothetical protein
MFLKGILQCSQSGKHPQGIYPNLAINKSVIILLYFWIYIENQIQKSSDFYFFHQKNLAIETLPQKIKFPELLILLIGQNLPVK